MLSRISHVPASYHEDSVVAISGDHGLGVARFDSSGFDGFLVPTLLQVRQRRRKKYETSITTVASSLLEELQDRRASCDQR